MNESVGSLQRRHCLPLSFRRSKAPLEHLVLPDAGSPSVGDTSPGFPRLEAELVEPELPHLGGVLDGLRSLQLVDELLASCLVGNQTLPRPLNNRLRLAQLHIDWSFLC